MNVIQLGRIGGLFGVTILVAVAAVTAVMYQGHGGEGYSPLNHFVSELGQYHHSAWAPVFNAGLVLGNLGLIPFTLAVSQEMGGKMGVLFRVLGLLTNLAGAAVGIVPMNNLYPHLIVAFVFFNSCLASVALFTFHSLYFARGPWGGWIAMPGLLSVICFVVFLGDGIHLRLSARGILHLLANRPHVWLLPASEWCVFVSILAWITFVACQLVERPKSTSSLMA